MLALLVLGVVLVARPHVASAAVGLRFGGCVGDLSGCARTSTVGALDGAEAVAVSGSNVYVAAASGNALSHFRLDSAGKPSFVGCIGDLSGCAKTSPGGALDGASGVAVRRRNLYVNAGEAVSHFTLDSAGDPSFVGCIGDLAGCTAITNPNAFDAGTSSVVVRGSTLYVSSLPDVSYFTLDSAGTPTFAGCLGNSSGSTGCTSVNPSNALNGAGQMAFSGGNLYVADSFGSNISHLTLASNGKPTFAGCIGDISGCTATNPAGALNVAAGVAAGGKTLYATGSSNSVDGPGAVSQLTLDSAGAPSFDLCVGEKSGCAATSPAGALDNAGRLLVSGHDLYAASLYGISHLTLGSTGKPSFQGCIGKLAGCAKTTPSRALRNATGLALRDTDLYVTSVSGNALSYLTK